MTDTAYNKNRVYALQYTRFFIAFYRTSLFTTGYNFISTT
ncbi:hypothetical protein FLA_2343 [Filimonas lacunae]|nr:hypothetical protein FLA_2343 [Filimonas lacunae]